MSYAEMEGLEEPGRPAEPSASGRVVPRMEHESVLIERWLWFMFLSLILVFAIGALAITAISTSG